MKTKYMHTLDRRPAYYDKGNQVVFAGFRTRITLADSLKQIRAEQEASRQWRKAKGYDAFSEYGYQKVLA